MSETNGEAMEKDERKPIMDLFLEAGEKDRQLAQEQEGITIPENGKEVFFEMEIGGQRYRAKLWRDGFRGINVYDDDGKLYALTFSDDGMGRFSDGWEKKGMEGYKISRDNFGLFAMRYSDHIQWLAGNLDKGVCKEVLELFTLGY